ncbi:MAG: LysR family transcriptional regulator [Gammaproteobacteria bacterium]|nr:LysR family transcriptional regulator [Gammaproteobacteria bacterium]
MNNANWDDLRIFLAAARSGSLSAASRELDSNQPTVGRRIAALEQALGMRLIQRHSQGLTLTEEGRRILEIVEDMDRAATTLSRLPQGGHGTVSGTVRIAAPEGLAVRVLAPALSGFARSHPDIEIILEPSSASADLTRGEADIAVRLYRPGTQDLVVRRIRDMEFGLYASADYLLHHGVPATTAAVQQHRFIGYGEGLRDHPENRWLEALIGTARFALRSDNTLTRLTAARAGMGIAVLPHLLTTGATLERVLPDITPPPRTIWLVVHRDLQHVARNRLVMEFLAETLAAA